MFTCKATAGIHFGRMLDSSFFLNANCFAVFRRMIVSSKKVICFQFVVLFYLESIFSMHFGKNNGFDKGRLYLAAASVLLLTVFFNLFVMSRVVTNVCCSARETICSFCLGVVARSDRIESFQSFDCFHHLSQYFSVVMSHLINFATAA